MTKSLSENADHDFMLWFNKKTQVDFDDAVNECDHYLAKQILESAFLSGYNKGCADYSQHLRSIVDNETHSDEFYYMCKTDFECELGYASGGNMVYPSVIDLKYHRPCVDECGIVAVKIEYAYTVEEGN